MKDDYNTISPLCCAYSKENYRKEKNPITTMLFMKEQQQVNIEMTYEITSETNSPSGDKKV